MRGGGIVIAAQPEGHPTTFYEGAHWPPVEGTHRLHDVPPGSELELLEERGEWVCVRWRPDHGPPLDGWAKKRNVRIETLQGKINRLKGLGGVMPLGHGRLMEGELPKLTGELITRMKATIQGGRSWITGTKEQWEKLVGQYAQDGQPLDPGWILLEGEPGVQRELDSNEKTLLGKWAFGAEGECPDGCVKQYVAEGLVVDGNLPVGIKGEGGKVHKLVLTYV